MRRPSSEAIARIAAHLRLAWCLGRPTRKRERIFSVLFIPLVGALVIAATMMQAVLSDGERLGYSSLAEIPPAVAVEAGPGLPLVPSMESSRHFRIVPREEAEKLVRLHLKGDHLVATIEAGPARSSWESSRNSLQTAITLGNELPDRTNFAAIMAIHAVKSLWREDALAGSSPQKWTWTNSAVPKRASATNDSVEVPAANESSGTASSETLEAIAARSTSVLAAILVYLGVLIGVAIVANLMSERSDGRTESYLSTDVGVGDVLLGFFLRPVFLAAVGMVLACGILLVVQWYFGISFAEAILLATGQSILYAPACVLSTIATVPVLLLLASRRWHPALLPVVYGGAVMLVGKYLMLPVLAAGSGGLAASFSSGGLVGSILAPVIRSLGPYASELAYLPLAGVVGALVVGWQGWVPFVVSLASGAAVVAYAYRLVLRGGRTWFLSAG